MNNRERREYKYSTMPAVILGLMMVIVGIIMASLRIFEVSYGEKCVEAVLASLATERLARRAYSISTRR